MKIKLKQKNLKIKAYFKANNIKIIQFKQIYFQINEYKVNLFN